jgi:phosphate acetyltransferase
METLENRTYDEIRPGDSARLERRLSERDIDLFAAVSGDLNPTHLCSDFAESGEYGRIVGHSMWGGALFSNLLGNVLPGPGTTYRSQSLNFHRPLAVGDTLTVSVTAKEKRQDGVVVFDCQGVNQAGQSVITGTAEVVAPKEKVRIERPDMPGVTVTDHEDYEKLIARCASLEPIPTAVAHPCDHSSLAGALEAGRQGLIVPVLVGPEEKIRALAEAHQMDLTGLRIVDAPHSHAAAAAAVKLIQEGQAEMLMKGSLHTDELMAAVVSSAAGLRTERRISHAFVMDVPTYPKILIVTDAAINITPDLEAKRDICQNAIDLAHVLGVDQPKVAILSAVETVTTKIPSTLEAASLCKMADRGQITGGVLDGPLAMDNAISPEAARTKGIRSLVAGVADILLAPDLEAGNILAKQLTFLARADAAGVVLGARVPVILTSRADDVRTRMASCAVAMLQAHARRGDTERER